MEVSCIKIIEPRHCSCCKWVQQKCRASFVPIGRHGAYHKAVASSLFEKESPKHERGCECTSDCNSFGEWGGISWKERMVSVSQMQQLQLFTSLLRWKWDSSSSLHRICHGHNASSSTLERNDNAKVHLFSLSMAGNC